MLVGGHVADSLVSKSDTWAAALDESVLPALASTTNIDINTNITHHTMWQDICRLLDKPLTHWCQEVIRWDAHAPPGSLALSVLLKTSPQTWLRDGRTAGTLRLTCVPTLTTTCTDFTVLLL